MNLYGAFATRVGILQRSTHVIDLTVRDTTGVSAYRLWGANTVDNAYGNLAGSGVVSTGPTSIIEVPAGKVACSPTIIKTGQYIRDESRRGLSSFIIDIEDYVTPGPIPPFGSDEDFFFARVQEKHLTTGWLTVDAGPNIGFPKMGPIMIVPTAPVWYMVGAAMTVGATAPAGTGCTVGKPPVFDMSVLTPLPLHIAFPRTSRSMRVVNLDDHYNMLMSYGLGASMVRVEPNETVALFGATSVSEIVLASEDATHPVSFSLECMAGAWSV
jgi:hypothetical protein